MPLTEFDLIEIARRFRLLEDACEPAFRRLNSEQISTLNLNLEACRDDMNKMQEAIRAAQSIAK